MITRIRNQLSYANVMATGAMFVALGGAAVAAGLPPHSVGPRQLKRGAVTRAALRRNAVTSRKLANGSVTLAKLSAEVRPLTGTLKSGQTLRGTFDLGGDKGTTVDLSTQTYQFPLSRTVAALNGDSIMPESSVTASCPGVTGGVLRTPQAVPGQICIYISSTSPGFKELTFDGGSISRFGFGLRAVFDGEVGETHFVKGLWAVTAP